MGTTGRHTVTGPAPGRLDITSKPRRQLQLLTLRGGRLSTPAPCARPAGALPPRVPHRPPRRRRRPVARAGRPRQRAARAAGQSVAASWPPGGVRAKGQAPARHPAALMRPSVREQRRGSPQVHPPGRRSGHSPGHPRAWAAAAQQSLAAQSLIATTRPKSQSTPWPRAQPARPWPAAPTFGAGRRAPRRPACQSLAAAPRLATRPLAARAHPSVARYRQPLGQGGRCTDRQIQSCGRWLARVPQERSQARRHRRLIPGLPRGAATRRRRGLQPPPMLIVNRRGSVRGSVQGSVQGAVQGSARGSSRRRRSTRAPMAP